jgi:uncharacterized protein with HEPN domain
MPKGRPVRLRLFDILDAIHGIELLLLGKSFEDYQASFGLQRAVERCLEIVSEAARYIPDDMRTRAPEIPWTTVEAFGNKTRHEYQTISARRIWRVAIEDIPPLKAEIRQFYAELKRPADPWPDAESK